MTEPQRLSEADQDAIAAKVLEGLRQPKALHEMSEWERTAYANRLWAESGIIPDRPNAGRTISDGSK
jgi:hypothetical protein